MTQFTDNNPHNIEAPQKLYIQYSHDIEFDYSTGRMPDGTESGWDWEEQYIPVSHVINGRTVGRHTFMRIKVGVPSYWTVPIAISNNVTNVDTVVSEFEDDGVTFSFTIKLTFTDGTSVESDPITIRNGEDGTKIASAVINEDGYLIMTYDDGTVINAGMAKGEDAVGIPQFGDDGSVLVIRSNIAGWEDPINILAENLSGTNPIEYDNITGIFSHNIDDGNRHIPVGGSLGALLSTDGAGNYTWEVLDSTLKAPDEWDASVNTYPTLYKGRAVEEGDTFYITVPGTMGTVSVNIGDLLVSKIDTPAQIDANWFVQESNRDQATESILGVAKIATQLIVDAGTNDTDFITSLKLNTLLLENYSYKINSLTGNSFASFQPDGTNEYLTVKGTDASLIAEFLNDSDISIFNVNQNDISTPYKMTVGTNLAYDNTEGLWFGDGNNGLYATSVSALAFSFGGTRIMGLTSTGIFVGNALTNNPNIRTVQASNILPGYAFIDNLNTGIGSAAIDQLSLIAGGVEGIRVNSTLAHSVAGIADYETLVVNDDDIPNRKFVVDKATFDATIGTGGEYATIQLAYDAGHRRLKVVGDVVEGALNTGASHVYVFGDDTSLITLGVSGSGTIKFVQCNVLITTNVGLNANFDNCKIEFDGGYLSESYATITNNSMVTHTSGLGIYSGNISDSRIYHSGGSNLYMSEATNCSIIGDGTILNGYLVNCYSTAILLLNQCNISNSKLPNSNIVMSIVELKVTNSKVNNITYNVENCIIQGNTINGDVAYSANADYNKLINNTIAGTTTLNTGAAYNVITGNTFTGAFTDNSGETTNIIKDNIG